MRIMYTIMYTYQVAEEDLRVDLFTSDRYPYRSSIGGLGITSLANHSCRHLQREECYKSLHVGRGYNPVIIYLFINVHLLREVQ